MRFSRILCAVDFTASSREALSAAVELARRGAALDICYVFERERMVAEIGEIPGAARVFEEMTMRAEQELDDWRKIAAASVPGVVAHSLGGRRAWDTVTEFSKRLGPDLLVVGAGSRRHGLLGSTAERILRHAASSVLVVVGAARPAKRILCAVDFSGQARDAVAAAAALAAEREGQLTLVHAFSVSEIATASMVGAADFLLQARRVAAENLRAWASDAEKTAGRPVATQIVDGAPAEAILAAARAGGQDLIVTGTHGHTGIARALLGSVAEHLVRHADRSVLVVRAAPVATPSRRR